jgi:hypothetical protein
MFKIYRSFFSFCFTTLIAISNLNAQIITTIAGSGTYGFSGDGGPATAAAMGDPAGIAFDAHGNLFVPDYDNARIRKIN